MKYEAHINTGEFSYIGYSLEGTAEDAVRAYKELETLYKIGNAGMPKKEFEEIIELMIAREPIQNDPGILESLNTAQKWALDIVRRATDRVDYKNR